MEGTVMCRSVNKTCYVSFSRHLLTLLKKNRLVATSSNSEAKLHKVAEFRSRTTTVCVINVCKVTHSSCSQALAAAVLFVVFR